MEMSRLSKYFIDSSASLVPEKTIDYGSRNGELARALGCDFADHRISNRVEGVTAHYIARGSDLPQGVEGVILAAQFSTALNIQLVRELLSQLAPGNPLYVLLDRGYSVTPFDELVIPYSTSESATGDKVLTFTRWDGPIDEAERVDEYSLEVGHTVLRLQAGPGVFSGEALDAGTQALLEVVKWSPGRVLDLGCGNGVVGLYAHAKGAAHVTMLDSDLRALRFAKANAARNGVDVEIIANDGLKGIDTQPGYDLILTNPPYHSDFSVAKGFIEDGYKSLALGGTMWLVVKKPDWYRTKFRNVFGGCRVISHNGYAILTAEKRLNVSKPARDELKTTRKHEKRMAASNKRR